MKKTFLVALLLLCSQKAIFSKQWLVFFSKEGFFDGVIRQSFGHAYIGLIQEDTILNKNVVLACFGFYPKGGIQSSGVFGFMEGEIRDDWKSIRDDGFIIEISEQELKTCLKLKNQLVKQKYSLRINNCLHFIKNFGTQISKLKLPKGYFLLPSSFISALKSENRDLEFKGTLKNIITKENLLINSKLFLKEKHKKLRDAKINFFKSRKNINLQKSQNKQKTKNLNLQKH
ncbi:MAG: hypothetical protein IPL42_00680 [Saprospiraceae bacterium]|nr:hypothetical protein [Saprospiraceae bacterium]